MSANLSTHNSSQPFVLFAQHGWADIPKDITNLARALSRENTLIYAPDLGIIDTWLMIEPLITKVEQVARSVLLKHPDLPWRIVGHSMGGLIWLELLHRHPEWLPQVHSLVVVGSPVGGSDLGRLYDPLRLFPLIARDLGTNRRLIAEAVAAQVPTLSIVGDIGNHTDGTVPVGCSQFTHASMVYLDGIRHATLKNHPRVAAAIRQFWANPTIAPMANDLASQLIAKLRSQDLTETHNQNFKKAKLLKTYPEGIKLWTWTNPLQIVHVFISVDERCVYSAYTGWQDRAKFAIALQDLLK
ncbi:alpha/beta hydrolase [Pseudanabaena mucicola]|uniref:Alpha/beta hydrolase n=1 Tax=Pseudanabaena mucicola FACHB-723 TaxID=2692860 RepID=A0ABR8A0X1_9CYAN|nr:alpha/beta hydrolase [Pseudanabaena mucicola]MBD2189012.1 alpha/beta hydrolase [Pseudanabaena mucicola FACHB-723]